MSFDAYINNQLRMLLIGAPGAGKGTQSARLQRDYGFAALSSGDLLRRHVAARTPVGQQAAEIMARGELVPDALMIRLILTELAQFNHGTNHTMATTTTTSASSSSSSSSSSVSNIHQDWLLDGFPRNKAQAASLDATLLKQGTPLNMVVSLQVPDEVILERILSRWVHAPSGRVYNLGYNPPLHPGLDDITGEPLTRRPDDTESVFRSRMRAFRETTEPLLEHYDRQGVLVQLKGETSDIIYRQLQKELLDRGLMYVYVYMINHSSNRKWHVYRIK
ncbi:P-loop containing nucleoside triphosphate hydrolase protein [Syncephalis plumigaleata]|nr:P-loop containing nucleoside triphosphate hydrolase protein [Syncephalis plumigaleata]